MIRGSRAVRIRPKVLLLTVVPGLSGRKLFVTLNASARNSTLWLSLKRNDRASDKSKDQIGTPIMLLRPMFPLVPASGIAKADALRYGVPGLPDLSPNGSPLIW